MFLKWLKETDHGKDVESSVRKIIGGPTSIKIERVLEESFKTVDGRIKESGFFTPGGDTGEFILGLQIF